MSTIVPTVDSRVHHDVLSTVMGAYGGARKHYGPPGYRGIELDGEPPAEDSGSCWGTIHALYTRRGSPPKWVRVGSLCLNCLALWPENWVTEGSQKAAARHQRYAEKRAKALAALAAKAGSTNV